jgi:hypothetical protein
MKAAISASDMTIAARWFVPMAMFYRRSPACGRGARNIRGG